MEHFHLSRAAFAVCLVLFAAGFAVRTWMRNLDWTNDKTMAIASVRTSPLSFKVHWLLAAQLLGADPTHGDIDRATAEADRSVAILSPLPDNLNAAGPWNLAAVCHGLKGDALRGDAGLAQYEETAGLARRSIAIDTASQAAYDRLHAVKSTVPVSAADAYRTLASACLHLGRPPQALAAAIQAQKIDPSNADAYRVIANVDLAQDQLSAAAIALAEGMFAAGDRSLLPILLRLYRSGLDPQNCAVVEGSDGPTLNTSCPIVREHLCGAASQLQRPDLERRLACPN
jgi:tetratricopeptide (TPR) repeat protein